MLLLFMLVVLLLAMFVSPPICSLSLLSSTLINLSNRLLSPWVAIIASSLSVASGGFKGTAGSMGTALILELSNILEGEAVLLSFFNSAR